MLELVPAVAAGSRSCEIKLSQGQTYLLKTTLLVAVSRANFAISDLQPIMCVRKKLGSGYWQLDCLLYMCHDSPKGCISACRSKRPACRQFALKCQMLQTSDSMPVIKAHPVLSVLLAISLVPSQLAKITVQYCDLPSFKNCPTEFETAAGS